MDNKFIIDQAEVDSILLEICESIDSDDFLPDAIVCVSFDAIVPSVMMSTYFSVPIYFQLEDDYKLWLADEVRTGMQVLVISDVHSCDEAFSSLSSVWTNHIGDDSWYDNTRFVSLHINKNSTFSVDYYHSSVKGDVKYIWNNWW